MPVQKVYSGGRDNKLISFDVIDITSGTGYVSLYPVAASGANILSRTTQYNYIDDSLQTSSNGNLRGFNENISQTYAAKFDRTLIIEGQLLANFNTVIRRLSGGSGELTSSWAITVQKYDGSTATQLGRSTHMLVTTIGDGQATEKETCHNIEIARTIFKKGDSLRIVLEGTNNHNSWDTWILIDSKNRSVTLGNVTPTFAVCSISVPFRLET